MNYLFSMPKQLNNNKLVNPFWVRTTKKDTNKKIFKEVFKWLKLLLYGFLTVVGLWGCFQTYADPTIATSTQPGQGLEIGFPYGTTNSWNFDLSSDQGLSGQGYSVFDDFTLAYGPFYAFFVWPASRLVMALMYSMRGLPGGLNTVFSIFILLIIIRLITILISLRATIQNEKMSEVQGKLAEVNAKYKNQNDAQSKQRKQMEVMAIYKKNNVKPFAIFEQMFVTLPIFLIVYRIVSLTRPIKTTILFNIWDLSLSPYTAITTNFTTTGWLFIFFVLLVIPAQLLQFKITQILSKKRNRNATPLSAQAKQQYKKTMITQWIFQLVFAVITVISPAGLGLYFFFNAIFTILQSIIIHAYIINRRKKQKIEVKIEDLHR